MKKKCVHCGDEFEPASGKQKFCSDRCRVANARAKNKGPEVVVPDHEKILLGLMEDPAVLTVLLLKHPRPQMVRSCCLHYLGDGYQQIDAFLTTQGWTPQDLLAAVQPKSKKEKGLSRHIDYKPSPKEGFDADKIKDTVADEPKMWEEVDMFMGHPIPAGLKGIDLTIWKQSIKDQLNGNKDKI